MSPSIHRRGLIGYDAILGDDEKAIEASGKPPAVRDSDHGALEPVEAVLVQRLDERLFNDLVAEERDLVPVVVCLVG